MLEEIRTIICRAIDLEPSEMPPKADFDELGIDSLGKLDMLMALEKTYKVQVPETRLSEFVSLDAVTAIMREYLAGSRDHAQGQD